MNRYEQRIIEIGLQNNAKLALPESSDIRIQNAKKKLTDLGFNVIKIDDYKSNFDTYTSLLSKKPFSKNWRKQDLETYLENPLHLAMALLENGEIDGVIAGADTATSDVLRSAIRTVGVSKTSKWVSSIFFMISPDGETALTFADCGVIPEPDSNQLAMIAHDSAKFHHLLTGEEPKIAFLSFSTKGSAEHYRVEKVRKAVNVFAKKYPNYTHDGELQFDTAFIPNVSNVKAPNSPLKGKANVFIFPNLDAGNIAYKIAQRLANYSALGPLLQGLDKPVHDLSRGCSVEDIVRVASITAMQKKSEYANI